MNGKPPPSHVHPSSPFPQSTKTGSAAGERLREEGPILADKLQTTSRLLASDDFSWFIQECVTKEKQRQEAEAIDEQRPGKQRKRAVRAAAVLRGVETWCEREYQKAMAELDALKKDA